MKYTIIWVRKDISPINQIIQSSHAAHLAGQHFSGGITNFVLFPADDIIYLEQVKTLLESNNIKHVCFKEPDIVDNGEVIGLSSIVTEPLSIEQKKLFKKFKLYK